jgi:isoleucyl-tRNA synthetase
MYAEVDEWEWNGTLEDPLEECTNPLDQWVISRLHQLVSEVETNMERYDIPNAMKPIIPFIEDASNWYVRRSRRRFWKSEDDNDKAMAYKTLHYVLVRLSYVLAPFTPFLAEELYQKLTGGESVHLQDWLPAGHVSELVVKDMEEVRDYVTQGLSLRAAARLKVRQPLASVTVPRLGEFVNFEEILKDELNVKAVRIGKELALDTELTPELKREGLMREVIRNVQTARKAAGLNVDDRIELVLSTDDKELAAAVKEHADEIKTETLATELTQEGDKSYSTEVKVEGMSLTVKLAKV